MNSRYIKKETIGHGGIGKTFKAFDSKENKWVIIKSRLLNVKMIDKYVNEISLVKSLNHPNINNVIDFYTEKNSIYTVFEYLDGISLREKIIAEGISLKSFYFYSLNIISAISYLHGNSIVHRDIKPDNILINRDNDQAILIDLDLISTLESHNQDNTEIIGTPLYMAPEYIKEAKYSFASDIYSLGFVFHEMLKGEIPYHIEKLNDLNVILNDKIDVKLEQIDELYRKKIETLLNKMLDKEPSNRPTINEVKKKIEDLDNILIYSSKIYESNKYKAIDDELLYTYYLENGDQRQISTFNTNENIKETFTFYRNHLDTEYNAIAKQANITFSLWKYTFIVGLAIIVLSVIFIIFGRTIEALMTISLEGLVYFAQRLFKIREEYFRKIMDDKSNHLKLGNTWGLIMQNINDIDNKNEKNKAIHDVIDSLRKNI